MIRSVLMVTLFFVNILDMKSTLNAQMRVHNQNLKHRYESLKLVYSHLYMKNYKNKKHGILTPVYANDICWEVNGDDLGHSEV